MKYEVEYWTKIYSFYEWDDSWPTETIVVDAPEGAGKAEIREAVAGADVGFDECEIKVASYNVV